MTKTELTRQLATRCDIPMARAQIVIETIIETMTRDLISGDKLEIRGFGTFAMKVTAPRLGRNPKTGVSVAIGERRNIAFKASSVLSRRINRV